VRGSNTNEKIGRVKAPLVIIHGDSDEMVPSIQEEKLFRSAKEPKTFWPVAAAHHSDLIFVAVANTFGCCECFMVRWKHRKARGVRERNLAETNTSLQQNRNAERRRAIAKQLNRACEILIGKLA